MRQSAPRKEGPLDALGRGVLGKTQQVLGPGEVFPPFFWVGERGEAGRTLYLGFGLELVGKSKEVRACLKGTSVV